MNTKKSLIVTTLIGGVLTVIANYILLMVGTPFTGVPETFMTLSAGPVIAWSVFGTIGAGITFMLARKLSQSPNKTFTTIASVLLMLMHVAAAVILVYTLTKYTKPKAI